MTDLTSMFDDGMDLDQRIEVASHMLKQAADEEGVDLSQFSEQELGGMLTDMVDDGQGEGGYEGDDGDEGGYEGDEDEEGKTASDVTVADVALEITKRASYQGIDLADIDADTYAEIFDKVAGEMSDPYFYEEQSKLAAQAANMDELGRVAARGFVDEINKLASDDEDDDDEKKEERREEKKAAIKEHAKKIWEGAKSLEQRASGAVGRAISKKGPEIGPQRNHISRGRKAIGGAAGAGAIGTGAAIHHRGGKKKKASLDEVAYAVDILRAAGYDL